LIETGTVVEVDRSRPLELCDYGLHASVSAWDALSYAPGSVVSRVRLYGEIVHGDDKCVAYRRRHLWVADASEVLRAFARRCALDVVDLWDAPPVVVEYLETPDGKKRAAAWAAAWAAAREAQNRMLTSMLSAVMHKEIIG
jgi:hypothetical protein